MANGITLMGRLQDYAGKAISTLYKTADKLANPVIDKIASIDFAGSYFGNPNIPDFMKYSALRRSFIADESAQTGRPTPPLPHGEVDVNYRKYIGLGLAAAVTFGVVGYALQKKDIGMSDIDAGISYAKHEIFGGAPAVITADNPIANGSAKATPQVSETPFLMYDGIKIIGDEQFQKDVVMTLEFAKKYGSPYDAELKNTKEIETASYSPERMAAANGNTSVNKNFLHDRIERKDIKNAVADLNHEDYHNYASLNDPKNNTEENAIKRDGKSMDNLSYVNQSEIEKFYQEFDFSKFKK